MTAYDVDELIAVLKERDHVEFQAFCRMNKIPCHTCHNRVLAVMSVTALQYPEKLSLADVHEANTYLQRIRARVGMVGGLPAYIDSEVFGQAERARQLFPVELLKA